MSRVRDLADEATRAWFAAQRDLLVPSVGGEAVRTGDSILTLVTGAPISVMNGVYTEHREPDVTRLRQAAADFAGRELGLPWCVHVRSTEVGAVLFDELAATRSITEPLMVLEPSEVTRIGARAAAVRVLNPADHEQFRAGVAMGFGMPEEIAELVGSSALLSMPEVTAYVVSDDNAVVAVGMGVRTHDAIGIYSVATVPEHRRRGLARAITERIIADGFANGARFAYLHSSDEAFELYRSIGFHTVEKWTYALFE